MIQINCIPNAREVNAEIETTDSIELYFDQIEVSPHAFTLFLRAFKQDQRLELWIRGYGKKSFALLKSFPLCVMSGVLGPKRKEGDRQIPEGIYYIDRFNPLSKFHLALGLDYPNKSDLILGDSKRPGNSIFIHGGCQSVGCLAISDDGIKEVYTIARKAILNGQSSIRIEIFPFDFSNVLNHDLWLNQVEENTVLWSSLKVIYDHFEESYLPGDFLINEAGNYILTSTSANAK